MVKHLQEAQPSLLSIMRIAIGLIIFSFGTAKILQFHPGQFTPPPGSLPSIAGLLELVLGFLFLIGFQTRAAAFLLSGEMALAYFISHFPKSVSPTENGGYAAATLCFVFLYFVTSGAGPLSVDAQIRGNAR